MWEGPERELGRRGARVGEKTPPLGCPWATIESEWEERQRKEGKGGEREGGREGGKEGEREEGREEGRKGGREGSTDDNRANSMSIYQ